MATITRLQNCINRFGAAQTRTSQPDYNPLFLVRRVKNGH